MTHSTCIEAIQQRFKEILPLSNAQIARLSDLCHALLLAKKVQLSFIARVLPRMTQQDSRIRWISRLLVAPFMEAEYIYHPLLKVVLDRLKLDTWHIVIDRTPWIEKEVDLLFISLSHYKHAIPLTWLEVPYGGTDLATAVDLVLQAHRLIPPDAQVVFHGDTEFGGHPMIQTLQDLHWDFILAQNKSYHIWLPEADQSIRLDTLPVSKRGYRVSNIRLFAENPIDGLNLFAFPHKRRDKAGRLKHETAYLTTSLPLTRSTKRLGRRRWGVEPMHKDFKSAGIDITETHITLPRRRQGLLLVVAVVYLLLVCLGCRLIKTGQRRQIDSKPKRQYSVFRLGWDYTIHKIVSRLSIYFPLSLPP